MTTDLRASEDVYMVNDNLKRRLTHSIDGAFNVSVNVVLYAKNLPDTHSTMTPPTPAQVTG